MMQDNLGRIYKPNDTGGEIDGSEEVAGGLVIAGGDGAELLEPGEEVLDQMARLVLLLCHKALTS